MKVRTPYGRLQNITNKGMTLFTKVACQNCQAQVQSPYPNKSKLISKPKEVLKPKVQLGLGMTL